MTHEAKIYLAHTYPDHADLFELIPPVEQISGKTANVPEAVLRVVIGQMLSRAAARTIFDRVITTARMEQSEPWMLEASRLKSCGLSSSKSKTIIEFRHKYLTHPAKYDRWPTLAHEVLQEEICEHWGMSYWTAGILSLFYFGNEDVFPKGDASLEKAIRKLTARCANKKRHNIKVLDAEQASPYRSYLALYLWRALDSEFI